MNKSKYVPDIFLALLPVGCCKLHVKFWSHSLYLELSFCLTLNARRSHSVATVPDRPGPMNCLCALRRRSVFLPPHSDSKIHFSKKAGSRETRSLLSRHVERMTWQSFGKQPGVRDRGKRERRHFTGARHYQCSQLLSAYPCLKYSTGILKLNCSCSQRQFHHHTIMSGIYWVYLFTFFLRLSNRA